MKKYQYSVEIVRPYVREIGDVRYYLYSQNLRKIYVWLVKHKIKFARIDTRNGSEFVFEKASDAIRFKLIWV